MATSVTEAMENSTEEGQVPSSNKPSANTSNLTTSNGRQSSSDKGEEDGLQQLHKRFAAMEAKLDLVNSVFDLPQYAADIGQEIGQTEQEVPIWKDQPFESMNPTELLVHYNSNYEFYSDIFWAMRRIRVTHNNILRINQARKDKLNAEVLAKSKSLAEGDTDTFAKLSIQAFLKGETAGIARVDWPEFIASKGDLETSILRPIEVISSEPEPQMILNLPLRRPNMPSLEKSNGHNIVESDTDAESAGERPLPERIKIHSRPLVAVFRHVMNPTDWMLAKDKSMVFLRPYKQLVYFEPELRECLAILEERFEGYDGNEPQAQAQEEQETDVEGGENTGEGAAPTPDKIPDKNRDNDEAGKLPSEGRPGAPPDVNKLPPKPPRSGHNTISGLLHLRCLMQFFDKNIKAKLDHINNPDCAHIFFHDLWYLYKPGDRVIDQSGKQAYVVLRVQTPRHKVKEPWLRWYNKPKKKVDSSSSGSDSDDDDEEDDPVILRCVFIDFDGKQFGPVSKKFKIPQFGERKEIRSLPVYPFRYAKNKHLQEDLVTRGKMLLDVSNFKSMYYMGVTLDTRDEIDSQVVVDFNEALADEKRRKKWEPTIGPVSTAPDDRDDEPCMASCCDDQAVHDGEYIDSTQTENYVRSLIPKTSLQLPSLLLSPKQLEDIPRNGEGLTEEELVVMTYRVFGFVLRSRKWAQLDLTFLRYENADARNLSVNAFERLELPAGHREMVKSLVIQHFRSRKTAFTKDEQTDLIKGKGKGLIMLLHGAPGVGKTTTAEGIAELFKKPLFQITCGDLGSTAREVEEELEKNFTLASRWGCILLLDEADVFLSARERMDFKRNGLVAVFLRVLEYYTGILFLTTNRIGDFDEAFASRVHMSLYYPALDEAKTLRVFELNLELIRDRFKKQGREIICDASSVEDFARQHFTQHKYSRWNGRQIRNLCQTALALAEYDAQGGDLDAEIDRSIPVNLQLKHFKTVQTAYLSFDEYLGDIRGTKGDRRAVDYGLRAKGQDTPYQTKSNRFSQRTEEMSARESARHAPSMSSDSTIYQVNSQEDPFQPLSQGYMPTLNQGMNVSPQAYQQYLQPQLQPQQQMGPMGNMGNMAQMGNTGNMAQMGNMGNMAMGFGRPGQQPVQGQPDPRLMQNQQYQQAFPRGTNAGFQASPVPQQSFPQGTTVGFQGSPSPQNSFQGQQEVYGSVPQARPAEES